MEQSTIRAFQKVLRNFEPSVTDDMEFPERFAVKRYLKKMEVPSDSSKEARRQKCFDDWITFDQNLTFPVFPASKWYEARLQIHKWIKEFRLGEVSFTNGSESTPTRGLNSVESKLMRSKWECTLDNWDLWAKTAYEHLAIKRATRRRFSAVMKHDAARIKEFETDSWNRFKHLPDASFRCFERKLSFVTFRRDSSRFSTVPKNNEKDRPIDVQPLCNMLVQRRIGNGLRDLLRSVGHDLDVMADIHRDLIQNGRFATIDLSNASDSVQVKLIEFLFPASFVKLLTNSRSTFTEGLDGNFWITKKISAMGNGFTFELMTLILLALGRQYDESFSVFGDDIIVPNQFAQELVKDLESVGFVVNKDKTFIDSKFRESCGGNYHDDFGYIESYDFTWPESIHDCVVLHNKAFALAKKYPTFRRLFILLHRVVPMSLQGPREWCENNNTQGYVQDVKLSTYFWEVSRPKNGVNRLSNPLWMRTLQSLNYNPENFNVFYGYEFKPETATAQRDHLKVKLHTGKIMMYLHGGRKTKDVITGRGSWQRVAYVTDGFATFRGKDLG